MKIVLTAFIILIFGSPIKAQNVLDNVYADQATVGPDSAKYYEGSIITVCGKVTGTHTGEGGVMMLNFGGAYPKNTFTAVVFADDVPKFKIAEEYEGKVLCVTGRIKIYRGKAEMVLKSLNQLREQ
jgi:hypothetical protein